MVVEDENIIALDICFILKELGFDVPAVATSGEESVERAGSLEPDLILMDIKLKGQLDGIGAARQIQKLHNIPIVYVTAFGDEVTLDRISREHPFGFINKPFHELELEETILRLLPVEDGLTVRSSESCLELEY